MKETFEIRPVSTDDKSQWNKLYQAYAEFYKVEQTQEMRDRVWSWLLDDESEVSGFVAVNELGELIGIAHYRPFARPLAAATGCYLDDLFVTPNARGSGAADGLINALKLLAKERGWSVIRWITAEDNYRARNLYDRIATRTHWVTYDIKL